MITSAVEIPSQSTPQEVCDFGSCSVCDNSQARQDSAYLNGQRSLTRFAHNGQAGQHRDFPVDSQRTLTTRAHRNSVGESSRSHNPSDNFVMEQNQEGHSQQIQCEAPVGMELPSTADREQYESPDEIELRSRSDSPVSITLTLPSEHYDENLHIFRRAVGINAAHPTPMTPPFDRDIEEGQSDNSPGLGTSRTTATGIYRETLEHQRMTAFPSAISLGEWTAVLCGIAISILAAHGDRFAKETAVLTALATFITGILASLKGQLGKRQISHSDRVLHFAELVVIGCGAALAALGGFGPLHTVAVVILTALSSAIQAGIAIHNMYKRSTGDQYGFSQLKDWIEETEALMSVGILGRDKKDAALLVEVAFRKYNKLKWKKE